MHYNSTNIKFKDFIKELQDSYNVNLAYWKSDTEALLHIATPENSLVARCDGLPNIYHFSRINSKSYILMHLEGDDNKSSVIELTKGLEAGDRQDTICKQFMCQEGVFIDGFETYGHYGLKNCIPIALQDQGECGIWVEKNWDAAHRNMADNDYLKDSDGDNMLFENHDAADHYIKSVLLKREYILAVNECCRPTYVITL